MSVEQPAPSFPAAEGWRASRLKTSIAIRFDPETFAEVCSAATRVNKSFAGAVRLLVRYAIEAQARGSSLGVPSARLTAAVLATEVRLLTPKSCARSGAFSTTRSPTDTARPIKTSCDVWQSCPGAPRRSSSRADQQRLKKPGLRRAFCLCRDNSPITASRRRRKTSSRRLHCPCWSSTCRRPGLMPFSCSSRSWPASSRCLRQTGAYRAGSTYAVGSRRLHPPLWTRRDLVAPHRCTPT